MALHIVDGLGSTRLKKLLDYFHDPQLAWEAKISEWRNVHLPEQVISRWQKTKQSFNIPDYFKSLSDSKIQVVTFFDEEYPSILKEIYDPPLIIYYRGDISIFQKPAIAVVGTRKITSYGRIVTEKLVTELVQAGLVIVSGLARGVDTLAHQVTLRNGGLTAAVLGAGLFNIYPSENLQLSWDIVENGGVVICEHPPSYPVFQGVFPARNRIISGLSIGVVVTEAAEDSGSMITARMGLEQGRDVFAVPGPITSSLSAGPAHLIKEGAKLVYRSSDILDELDIDQKIKDPDQAVLNLSQVEKRILDSLENEQKHIDEISRELRIVSSEVAGSLIKMEIRGFVKNLGGGVYLKNF